jgi:hypothetical protein
MAAEALFGGDPIKVRIPFKPTTGRIRPTVATVDSSPKRQVTKARQKELGPRGPLLWAKRLVASDVQRQPGHATGGVRLTQAAFRIRGKLIDHTRYFRHRIFKNLSWKIVRRTPKVEQCDISVSVTIDGVGYGVHTLAVGDKQSGEARQRNYTSLLHWRGLGSTIRDLNLTGKILKLYAPAPRTREPFFIEIS